MLLAEIKGRKREGRRRREDRVESCRKDEDMCGKFRVRISVESRV